MQKKYKKYYSGFTLIELLAVISIIGIMTSVAIVSMDSVKSNAKLKAAQAEVASAIKLAQSYAMQGKQAAPNVCGYGFRFTTNSTYQIFYQTSNCSDKSFIYSAPVVVPGDSYSLPGGVTLGDFGNSSVIFFTLPHGNAYCVVGTTGCNAQAKITSKNFAFSISGLTKIISVNPAGMIY